MNPYDKPEKYKVVESMQGGYTIQLYMGVEISEYCWPLSLHGGPLVVANGVVTPMNGIGVIPL